MPRVRQELLRATAIGSAVFGSIWQSASAAPPVPYSWSGYYVGGFAGGATNSHSLHFDTPDSGSFNTGFLSGTPRSFNTPFAALSDRASGTFSRWPDSFNSSNQFVAGFTGGYNFQHGNLVYGFEVDFSLLGRTGRRSWDQSDMFSGPQMGKGVPAFTDIRNTHLDAGGGVDGLATFRGRVGLAMDRWLVFGTAGLAVGHATLSTAASVTETYNSQSTSTLPANRFDVANTWVGSHSDIRLGYAIGGGVEYAVTDRFRLKFDSLYYNLGNLRAVAHGVGFYSQNGGAPTALTVEPYTVSKRLDGALFRLGFNYGF